eukprot:TRINITY_DN5168_c0_g1_i1.p1 TRINITY_DN5168_c0_g1~~TRINITY_DN5168_c0_g1_i1.p1  ORF type:complete len:337 (+),score=34.34 TRINITY_DN5168_c0_g1_i1:17-1027(+)
MASSKRINWVTAISTIPRLSKEEFSQLDLPSKWFIATRFRVMVITFLSAAIAGILAFKDGLFDTKVFLLVTLGLTLAHATNNLINDYVDWIQGVDQGDYFRGRYGSHPMVMMSKRELEMFILVTGLSALAVGLYLCYLRGTEVVILTIIGAFFLLFYTYPLKHYALGEVSVFLVWGILMIGGGYFTITQRWSWDVVIASCPYSLGATTVIFGKHIDKIANDTEKKINTLPVVLGEYVAERCVLVMIALQYLLVIYLVQIKYFSPLVLAVLPAIYLDYKADLWRIYTTPKPKEKPANYPANVWPLYFVAYAFQHNSYFGGLFLLGIILDTFFGKLFF